MSLLKVLVIGGGAREHALAWAISRSPRAGRVFVAPGNGGTEWTHLKDRVTTSNIPQTTIPDLIAFAKEQRIDLTVAGPLAPYVNGIVDQFRVARLNIFGPVKDAASLESSRAFGKRFMRAERIPTAAFETFTDYPQAAAYIQKQSGSLLVKADGGPGGVFPCATPAEALDAAKRLLIGRELGAAGKTIIVEKRLEGTPLSVFAFTNGKDYEILDFARRTANGAQNVRGVDQLLYGEIVELIRRTVMGMERRGLLYSGLLGAHLMLMKDGPQVLEYGVTFGDPETLAILPALRFDIVELMLQCAGVFAGMGTVDPIYRTGALSAATIGLDAESPDELITGIDAAEKAGALVFHEATRRSGNILSAAGNRILYVSTTGPTPEAALDKATAAANTITRRAVQGG